MECFRVPSQDADLRALIDQSENNVAFIETESELHFALSRPLELLVVLKALLLLLLELSLEVDSPKRDDSFNNRIVAVDGLHEL